MALDMLPPPVSHASGGMEIRELSPIEIASLEPLFRANHATLPDPATSTFIGAVDGGKVAGFLVLQVKLHCEPVVIEPGYSRVFTQLIRKAEEIILERCGPQWVYCFTPAGRVSQLAQSMGMAPEPYVVMSKLVMPEAPPKPVLGLDLPDHNTGNHQPFEYDDSPASEPDEEEVVQ